MIFGEKFISAKVESAKIVFGENGNYLKPFPHVSPAACQAFDIMNQQKTNPDDDFSCNIDNKRYATVEHYCQS
jgi:hypothetical protein